MFNVGFAELPTVMFTVQLIPRLPSHLFLLVLSIFTTHTLLCLAVECYGLQPFKHPLPSDCRHILAHMPFSSVTALPIEHTSSVFSIPFFPIADFDHGTCSISLIFLDPARNSRDRRLPDTMVPATWVLMREAAASIVRQCVDNGMNGAASDDIDTTEITWTVMITYASTNDAQREYQKRALRSDGQRLVGRAGHFFRTSLFSRTFYFV